MDNLLVTKPSCPARGVTPQCMKIGLAKVDLEPYFRIKDKFFILSALTQGPGKQILEGKKLFEGTCADCHRINGQGLPDKFPALAGNPFVVGDPTKVIDTVLNGCRGKLGQMPTWKGTFTDQQLAAIISYVRQAWSNKAGPITAEMVKKRRK
jgi:cytochrome c6